MAWRWERNIRGMVPCESAQGLGFTWRCGMGGEAAVGMCSVVRAGGKSKCLHLVSWRSDAADSPFGEVSERDRVLGVCRTVREKEKL